MKRYGIGSFKKANKVLKDAQKDVGSKPPKGQKDSGQQKNGGKR